jgi:CheY-like chemotaxis protein
MSAKKLRIIVFEDDKALADLLQNVFQGDGHEVLTFSDPTVCPVLQNYKAKCPQKHPCADVVISDIEMPHMSGIELLSILKSRGCKALNENRALMSADTSMEQRNAAKELGCHFFAKPFKLTDVTTWLETCASRVPEGRLLAQL